jgi:hypothetical protein
MALCDFSASASSKAGLPHKPLSCSIAASRRLRPLIITDGHRGTNGVNRVLPVFKGVMGSTARFGHYLPSPSW